MLLIALAGKPNCGKSTFFKSLTLANVEIANYPFTTIDANKGVAYVRSVCPCKELGIEGGCGNCVDGVRFTPVELLDVAGLVPDAHKGRGLGNQFLDNLREADVIIQVVDASGSTDAEGNPVDPGTRDPLEDVTFLRYEFAMWMAGIVQKHLPRLVRQAQGKENILIDLLGGALAGLRIDAVDVRNAVDECGINLAKASDEDIEKMCEILLGSAISSAVVFTVIGCSAPFGYFLTSNNIPAQLTSAVLSVFSSRFSLVLMTNIVLLFLGCFLETQSIIILCTPIFVALAPSMGMTAEELGILIVVNTSIGMITPPMGVNLFVACGFSGQSLEQVSKRLWPYLLAEVAVLLLISYVPHVISWLPGVLGL